MPDHVRDALDLLARQRVGQERAVHATTLEDLAELHAGNLSARVEPRVAYAVCSVGSVARSRPATSSQMPMTIAQM